MTDIDQFRGYVLRPSLKRLEPAIPWTLAAEQLVLGTILHESANLTYVDQRTPGPGPAYGPPQIEEATYLDLWEKFIAYRPALAALLRDIAGHDSSVVPPVVEMHGNHFYACAMCRVFYRRLPQALPAEGDAIGMAHFYKTHYNTPLGKATVASAYPSFARAVQPFSGVSS